MEIPSDRERLVDFLGDNEWPFHARRVVRPADVIATDFSSPDVESYWVVERGQTVGLVRLFDLGDIGEGAPQFDLRIAGRHRGRGHGKRATRWVVDHLFGAYPELHRIEANTRHDNAAMQRALAAAGFVHEGTLRSSWHDDNGRWFDTLVYGLLRTDRTDRAG